MVLKMFFFEIKNAFYLKKMFFFQEQIMICAWKCNIFYPFSVLDTISKSAENKKVLTGMNNNCTLYTKLSLMSLMNWVWYLWQDSFFSALKTPNFYILKCIQLHNVYKIFFRARRTARSPHFGISETQKIFSWVSDLKTEEFLKQVC
jgi:hypothetical protein